MRLVNTSHNGNRNRNGTGNGAYTNPPIHTQVVSDIHSRVANNRTKLEITTLHVLTLKLSNRVERYTITDEVVRPAILDPKTDFKKPMNEAQLLRYFRRHYSNREIEHSNGLIETTGEEI
jgi:hypothetical protein